MQAKQAESASYNTRRLGVVGGRPGNSSVWPLPSTSTGLPRGRRRPGGQRQLAAADPLAEPGRPSLRLEPRLFSDPDTSSTNRKPSPAAAIPVHSSPINGFEQLQHALRRRLRRCSPSDPSCPRGPAAGRQRQTLQAAGCRPLPVARSPRPRVLSFVTGHFSQTHRAALGVTLVDARKLARFGRLCAQRELSCDTACSSLCSPAMTRLVNTTRYLPTEPGPRSARCGPSHAASRLFGAAALRFRLRGARNRLRRGGTHGGAAALIAQSGRFASSCPPLTSRRSPLGPRTITSCCCARGHKAGLVFWTTPKPSGPPHQGPSRIIAAARHGSFSWQSAMGFTTLACADVTMQEPFETAARGEGCGRQILRGA